MEMFGPPWMRSINQVLKVDMEEISQLKDLSPNHVSKCNTMVTFTHI